MDIYIAAPFGNYIKPANTIPVIGTFTHRPRAGLLWRCLTTLRYANKEKCWYNALGLRNPGITKGLKRHKPDEVLSIAAIADQDFTWLNAIIPIDIPLEINISCPNVNHLKAYLQDLTLNFLPRNPIIKLAPTMPRQDLDFLMEAGFTNYHASNTLPTNDGARSGKVLQPYTIDTIHYIKARLGDKARVIAGGGITHFNDIDKYMAAGADAFSLGTVWFNPYNLYKLLYAIEGAS